MKFKALHVSNLKSETKPEDLKSFMLTTFSEVKCELLESRYPDSYSSFKVLNPSEQYDNVPVQAHWSNRASFHNSYQRKSIDQKR